jgi:Glycosyltransferase family 87
VTRMQGIVLVSIALLPLLLGGASVAMRVEDFGGYWCGARLLLEGSDPYDPEAILRLERDIEPERESPQMPWGPPWAFVLMMPFAWLDYAAARWLCLAVMSVALAWASVSLWRLYVAVLVREGRQVTESESQATFGWLTCFSFYPVALLLALGQVSVADPLALAGFLVLSERRADFRAGLVLSLIAVKPQVVLLFALAALIWIVRQKRWRILVGGASSLALQTGLVLWLNPRVFHCYVEGLSQFGPSDVMQPTPASVLRLLAGGGFWTMLLPLVAGLGWLIWRMAKSRPWCWERELPNLSFACLLSTPHAWVYDFGILLVPLQKTAVSACLAGPLLRWTFLGIHLLATAGAFAMNLAKQPESDYIWLLPLYLVLYLVVSRSDRNRNKLA